jgi:hypothetical protein
MGVVADDDILIESANEHRRQNGVGRVGLRDDVVDERA